ncbi:MAG: YncE family protein [Planctomycetota bacterium]|nr:YncE family protein [Planctomycetota bacterium]
MRARIAASATLALGLMGCAATEPENVRASSIAEWNLEPEEAGYTGPLDYYVYVTAESADEIYKVRFDGKEAEIDKVIEVGYLPTDIEGPHGLTVSPDRKHWYLTMAHGRPYGLLQKFDAETDELVGEVELGLFPATMQISSATGLLYCVNFDLHGDMAPSTVSVVDPDAMVEVARTTTGPMPHGSRLSPDGRFHYSCAMMTGQLFEIDAASFEVTRVLKLGLGTKPTWVHPHPTKRLAYVCLNGKAQVAEIDLDKWEIVRRFDTGKGPYNVEVTPDGKKILVSYKGDGAVGIWDLASGEELARIPSSRKVTHGVVISSDGRYGFVSCESIGADNGTLDIFDMRTNELVDTIELGLQAGGICFLKAVPRT